jgi:DeoR family fructose operon transcriptional repressor
MLKSARERFILQHLEKHGIVNINELMDFCQVSEITIRRDLTSMERNGQVIRTHGGAMLNDAIDHVFSFSRRADRKKARKIAISKCAADFVRDFETICIDCGTTLFRMCDFIQNRRGLKVITNSIPVASELIKYPDIKVYLAGGEVFSDRRAIYGPTARENILSYHADKAFIGTDGISLKKGLSSHDENEASITRSMAEISDKVFLLCDSSKIEKDSFYTFGSLSLFDSLITDRNLTESVFQNYKEKGIDVIKAI